LDKKIRESLMTPDELNLNYELRIETYFSTVDRAIRESHTTGNGMKYTSRLGIRQSEKPAYRRKALA
jgi:hypothetical protein